jgi:hypothetical protein
VNGEQESWRKAFEKIGPELLRLQIVSHRQKPDPYIHSAERWLLEQTAAIERQSVCAV